VPLDAKRGGAPVWID